MFSHMLHAFGNTAPCSPMGFLAQSQKAQAYARVCQPCWWLMACTRTRTVHTCASDVHVQRARRTHVAIPVSDRIARCTSNNYCLIGQARLRDKLCVYVFSLCASPCRLVSPRRLPGPPTQHSAHRPRWRHQCSRQHWKQHSIEHLQMQLTTARRSTSSAQLQSMAVKQCCKVSRANIWGALRAEARREAHSAPQSKDPRQQY
jgi:hypothetical protein